MTGKSFAFLSANQLKVRATPRKAGATPRSGARKRARILITCAGGAGPLYLARHLKERYDIFLVDGAKQPLVDRLGLPFSIVPFGNSPDYIKILKRLVKRWRIDFIVPGADEELAPVYGLCRELGTVATVSPEKNFIELCLNKKKLMESLADNGFSQLRGYSGKSSVVYPAVVKPIYGRGSRQMHIVSTPSELDGYLKLYKKDFSDVLVQPYIDGQEYTVSVIVNDRNALIGVVPKFVILKRGITRIAVTKRHAGIELLAAKIVKHYQPAGPFNIQLMVKGKEIYVFEINPRLSTTAVLTDQAFGNEVELFIRFAGNGKIAFKRGFKEGIIMYRHDEHSFLDGKKLYDA